ncbi:MAG: hypothetical protein DWQ07_06630 [Chloroflexi bacterium]|nr:MAG: hypothetical protein DWQ07_06630 [Chloroflexota bacterium]MBL1195894.1 hypothetical protein [Chloroflexota bacterium]
MFLAGMPAIHYRNFWSFAAVYLSYFGFIVFAGLWGFNYVGGASGAGSVFGIGVTIFFICGNAAYPLPFFYMWFVFLPRYRAARAAP